MTPLLLLGVAAVSAALLIAGASLLLRDNDQSALLARRMDAARGVWTAPERSGDGASGGETVMRSLSVLGRVIMRSGILPGRTREEMEGSLASSGLRGTNALAIFLGAKLALVVAGPAGAWLLAQLLEVDGSTRMLMTLAGFVVGLLAPDKLVARSRKRYLARLEAGLPNALDLLVICAQAGLSLEPAMARVAAEMRQSSPEVAAEFEQTVRELEISSSAQAALAGLSKRTQLDTLRRLVSTLTQTMQYGTPLTEALRTLSAEVRQTTLTKFEARAARLPVLLTLPMILFILPCVFLVVGGPAAIQVIRSFGH